jgi:CRISPR/Cas system-associated exonuclease Cas4 (RecB family)
MIKLSPSTLNLMEECPRCFWLHVVKNIKRPSGPMAGIVIKMDSIIKKYFNRYREQDKLPPIIKGKVKGKLPKDMPKTLYSEEGEIKLKGLPDEYLELEDGSIVPFDHKTKSKAPEENHPAYQLQLDVYTYLLIKNGYKTVNKGYLAYYYPDDCDVHNGLDMNCEVVEVKTNPDRVVKLINKAKKIINNDIPDCGKDCEYCRWVGDQV